MIHPSFCAPRVMGTGVGLVAYPLKLIQSLALWVILAAVLLGGCAMKLAPDYDKAIFDGLTKANEDAMKLFASVPTAPFSKREDGYNSVIGELNAVLVQIKARPMPTPPRFAVSFLSFFGDRNAPQQAGDPLAPPTVGAVNTLIKIMTTARNDDLRGRLANRDALAFVKDAFATQMAQALVYEKALQR